jgi:hypothetical protein
LDQSIDRYLGMVYQIRYSTLTAVIKPQAQRRGHWTKVSINIVVSIDTVLRLAKSKETLKITSPYKASERLPRWRGAGKISYSHKPELTHREWFSLCHCTRTGRPLRCLQAWARLRSRRLALPFGLRLYR